jgi:hypothetical protein
MALIKQGLDTSGHGPTRIPSGPDYEREAEDARLKLRGDELLADSSRLYPRGAPVASDAVRMEAGTKC